MIRGISIVGLLAVVCWIGGGCCCMNQTTCGGPGAIGCGSCGDGGCGVPGGSSPCGSSCGGCASSGPVDACDCGQCNACTGCGGGLSCLFRPVHELAGSAHRSLTCGAGCGELYIDEWISDPPDACDPCGCHGDWNGCGCHEWPLLSKLKFLWNGYRYYGDCEPSCTSCAGPSHEVNGYHTADEYTEVIEADTIYGQPTLAPQRSIAPSATKVPGHSALRQRPATHTHRRYAASDVHGPPENTN